MGHVWYNTNIGIIVKWFRELNGLEKIIRGQMIDPKKMERAEQFRQLRTRQDKGRERNDEVTNNHRLYWERSMSAVCN